MKKKPIGMFEEVELFNYLFYVAVLYAFCMAEKDQLPHQPSPCLSNERVSASSKSLIGATNIPNPQRYLLQYREEYLEA